MEQVSLKHKHKQHNRQPEKYTVGTNIRCSYSQNILLIDENNVNCGDVPFRSALDRADSLGLQLVQVSPGSRDRGPTCKILDFSKFKYDMQKKEKLAKKKQRESSSKVKEIKFRPSTDINDLRIKAKQAEEFIDEGHKVKITITFKGRELMHANKAHDTMNSFLDLVENMEMTSPPSMSGRSLSVMGDSKDKK